MQWWSADQSHPRYTGNRGHGVDHAPLHGEGAIVAVTGDAQIGIDQHRVVRLKTEVAVERARQSAHGHQRGSDQHRTNRNLYPHRQVSQSNPPPNPGGGARLDDLIWIGVQHLSHGNRAKQEAAG